MKWVELQYRVMRVIANIVVLLIRVITPLLVLSIVALAFAAVCVWASRLN